MSTAGQRLRMARTTWRKTRAASAPSGVLPGRRTTATGLPVVASSMWIGKKQRLS
jgi:hypothetical protein